ncbi:MAG TPA: type VI secretion system ATPase TssH [Rhodospirillaceae bacterium]|nr:type VI secretion system ATPase TssH [Rhodospirillaceae bacterium]HAT35969.1 type VI secretion system ATPase TssH [Rhodospirillaceae bacterium]
MHLDVKTLVGKLNSPCREALENAAHLALDHTHYCVEIEHFLLKLFERGETDIAVVVRQYDVDANRAVKELTKAVERSDKGNERTPSLSPAISALLQEAWEHSSLALGASAIRSGAILQAVLDDPDLIARLDDTAPTVANMYRERLRADLPDLIELSKEEMPLTLDETPEGKIAKVAEEESEEERSALERFTQSLTEQAAVGLIDPIIGRDGEIRQIIDILMRRRQNNPILTGEAGVGKTAIVEGFAQRIAAGNVPAPLADVDVRVLDVGLLRAGAGVQGEFEARLKEVIAEVRRSARPVVLFIDEAHGLIGAGDSSGAGDAANLLKPALARGELRTIAATTWADYKRHVERDPALARRFQVVKVVEPTSDDAIAMLRGISLRLEEHHKVRILDEALQEAVRLSVRYISDGYLPDKAVALLDTACARVAIARHAVPPELEAATRRSERLRREVEILASETEAGENHGDRLATLKRSVKSAEKEGWSLAARWDQERDLVAEIDELWAEAERGHTNGALKARRAELSELQGDAPMVPACVDTDVVACIVAERTGIPLGRMKRNEIDAIVHLEEGLSSHIIGQQPALALIAERLRSYRAGLDEPYKPAGVFLFVGPSGVGKTETATSLAEVLYGGADNLITLNMSEYQESHSVSKLKGAPAGYVGYGDGGVLTEAVRRAPHAVILLDEVENADADVLALFDHIFDKGTLEDAEGLEVDFKNCLFVLTTDLGANAIADAAGEGKYDAVALADHARPHLLKQFKAAFLNRVSLVPFLPLGRAEIRAIVAQKLARLQTRFEKSHGESISVSGGLMDMIARQCVEAGGGARQVDQILEREVLAKLSGEILRRMAEGEAFGPVNLSLTRNRAVQVRIGEDKG